MKDEQEGGSYVWTEQTGRLRGYVCSKDGREWGMVFATRNMKHGTGWSSTFGGFFTQLEDAQAAHVEAIEQSLLKQKAYLAGPPQERVYSMTPEQRCKAAGIPFVNYKVQRAKQLDEERARQRRTSEPRFG